MPISHVIHSDFHLIITRYTGYVTDDEYRSSYKTIFSSPDCKPGFNELADIRELEKSSITSNAMRIVAAEAKKLDGHSKTRPKLAVVLGASLQFGLFRMYGAYADVQNSETVRRFYDVKEALEWLNAKGIPLKRIHCDLRD